MKRLIGLVLALTLALGCVSAQATNLFDRIAQDRNRKPSSSSQAADSDGSGQGWTCENCGQRNEGNFCGNCGAARPVIAWTCPSCGQQNEGNFCGNCGAARPTSLEQPSAPAREVGAEDDSGAAVLNTRVYSQLIPEVFVGNLNAYTNLIVPDLYKGLSDEEIADILSYVTLTYTEAEGDTVYYNNPDWSIEAACFFYEGTPDKDSLADEVSVNFSTGEDAKYVTLLQMAMALCCKEADPAVDSNSILDWMWEDRKTGDEFQLTGCYLAVMIADGRCQYSLVRKAL